VTRRRQKESKKLGGQNEKTILFKNSPTSDWGTGGEVKETKITLTARDNSKGGGNAEESATSSRGAEKNKNTAIWVSKKKFGDRKTNDESRSGNA